MKTKAKKSATKKKVARRTKATQPATVLVLRTCDANLKSRDGAFQWAGVGGETLAPDWSSQPLCGSGLHGWLWGSGDWSLEEKAEGSLWLVVEVDASKVVDLGGKVKFPKAKTLAVESTWQAAMGFIRGHAYYAATHKPEAAATGEYGHAAATGEYGHAAATGDYGHAAATGYYGHAAATGYSGHAAATGYSGHAAATGKYGHAAATGYSGHAAATGEYGRAAATGDSGHAAATGDYGHAAATGEYGRAAATGYSGHAAATGKYGWASSGYSGKAKAGDNGVLSLLWWDGKRPRLVVGYVNEDGIKADTWYSVENGKLKEVAA